MIYGGALSEWCKMASGTAVVKICLYFKIYLYKL